MQLGNVSESPTNHIQSSNSRDVVQRLLRDVLYVMKGDDDMRGKDMK